MRGGDGRDAFVTCARTRNGKPVNENATKIDLTLDAPAINDGSPMKEDATKLDLTLCADCADWAPAARERGSEGAPQHFRGLDGGGDDPLAWPNQPCAL